jgi:ubiquinone/menaquinone biosynthesis C-methylase UbiE
MTAETRQYGKAFDRVAEEYDRYRPVYPDAVVDEACRVAGIGPGDRVLEVGCGTGQLTQSLLARGLDVVAVEPGERLLELARRNLSGKVEFVHSRFEDVDFAAGGFRAVFSASAWHWVDPEIGWRKAARLLAPGGTLALIQFSGFDEELTSGDSVALIDALARVAPEVAADWPKYRDLPTIMAGAEERRANVSEVFGWISSDDDAARAEAGRLFADAQLAVVPGLIEHTGEELSAVMRTTSMWHRLSPAQRDALERENLAIYERLGRPIRSSTVAVLVSAKKPVE